MAFKCPKCGKPYKTQGKYYQKHIESCTGKKQPSKAKKKIGSTKKAKASSSIINRLDNIELRLRKLEENFKKTGARNNENLNIYKKAMIFPVNNELEIIEIIKNIIIENSNLYSIKGVISLEHLKDVLYRNYSLSEKLFEDTILKLYRRELVDLQAGGTPEAYHLESPTGKKFYYLLAK